MTLKKCTVTQLDDTFWRVDWEGPAAEARTANCTLTANSPSIAERDGESWFFCGIWSQSLAEALARFNLTIEDPEPETAEERVRALVSYGFADSIAFFYKEHHVAARDLAAILAELDRLRAREAKFALGPSTDAVLAPIRKVLSDWADRGSDLASSRDRHMAQQSGASPNYIEAGIAEVERWSFMVAANSLREALAEAEKIARGE